MSYYYSSGPNISGMITKLTPDYPEEIRSNSTVADEPTAPPTYSTGNLVRRSQPLIQADDQRLLQLGYDSGFQLPEEIRKLQKSIPNLNEKAGNNWLNGSSGGGSLSGFRPQNKSVTGPGNHFSHGEGPDIADFGQRERSYNGSLSTGNTSFNPLNARHSMTGNNFRDAYKQFNQLNVVQENL